MDITPRDWTHSSDDAFEYALMYMQGTINQSVKTIHMILREVAISGDGPRNKRPTQSANIAMKIAQQVDDIYRDICCFVHDEIRSLMPESWMTPRGLPTISGDDAVMQVALMELNNKLHAIQDSIAAIRNGEAGTGNYTDALKLE